MLLNNLAPFVVIHKNVFKALMPISPTVAPSGEKQKRCSPKLKYLEHIACQCKILTYYIVYYSNADLFIFF